MSPFSQEKIAEKRASVKEACSSWANLKQALQVKNTLGEDQSRYTDADPLWINEGKPMIRILFDRDISIDTLQTWSPHRRRREVCSQYDAIRVVSIADQYRSLGFQDVLPVLLRYLLW